MRQSNVIYLLMCTLNTANDHIDNIRRDLQQSLYDVSGWCCRNRMASDENKMHVEGDETKIPPPPPPPPPKKKKEERKEASF